MMSYLFTGLNLAHRVGELNHPDWLLIRVCHIQILYFQIHIFIIFQWQTLKNTGSFSTVIPLQASLYVSTEVKINSRGQCFGVFSQVHRYKNIYAVPCIMKDLSSFISVITDSASASWPFLNPTSDPWIIKVAQSMSWTSGAALLVPCCALKIHPLSVYLVFLSFKDTFVPSWLWFLFYFSQSFLICQIRKTQWNSIFRNASELPQNSLCFVVVNNNLTKMSSMVKMHREAKAGRYRSTAPSSPLFVPTLPVFIQLM